MGLSLLNALPDPQSQMDSMRRALADANQEREELRAELREERARSAGIERGAQELRKALNPLYSALRHIYGEIEEMGVGQAAEPGVAPRVAAVWQSWKAKLGAAPAKAIEILMLHGAMTQGQLRLQMRCAHSTCSNAVTALNKAGLIDKSGGKISLKQL
jgi:hypothetical protein